MVLPNTTWVFLNTSGKAPGSALRSASPARASGPASGESRSAARPGCVRVGGGSGRTSVRITGRAYRLAGTHPRIGTCGLRDAGIELDLDRFAPFSAVTSWETVVVWLRTIRALGSELFRHDEPFLEDWNRDRRRPASSIRRSPLGAAPRSTPARSSISRSMAGWTVCVSQSFAHPEPPATLASVGLQLPAHRSVRSTTVVCG